MAGIAGIVTIIDANTVTIATEEVGSVVLPRLGGDVPGRGTAVEINFDGGTPKLFIAPPVTEAQESSRFLNFYAVEDDGKAPEVDTKAPVVKARKTTNSYGPAIPYSFIDTPIGAKTIIAANGNLMFAGPTAVGMATSCSGKMIIREDGEMEQVTPHYVALLGKTVYVSDFLADISIEIDIMNTEVDDGVDFSEIKSAIAKAILGEGDTPPPDPDAPPPKSPEPVTYETAFDAEADKFQHPAFIKMFGLHIAEILCSFKWTRVKFRGKEKTFHEAFDGVAEFQNYIGYCKECFETDKIAELEFFLVDKTVGNRTANVTIPNCEEQTVGGLYEPFAIVNGEEQAITAMIITLTDGTLIEYFSKKRTYAFSHGTIAESCFVSASKHGSFFDKAHMDIDKLTISNLTFDTTATNYCDSVMGLPTVHWNGDFRLDVSGSLTLASGGPMELSSSISAILGGGTKGIKIDSSGSSAITI